MIASIVKEEKDKVLKQEADEAQEIDNIKSILSSLNKSPGKPSESQSNDMARRLHEILKSKK